MDPILSALQAEIEQTSLRDQWQLKKRLHGIAKIQDPKSRMAVIDVIKGDVEKAKQKVEKKRLNMPKIVYLLAKRNKLFLML